MSARQKADQLWSSQPALASDGMSNALHGPEETTEGNLADVFNLWAERIADAHETVRQLSL